MSRHSFVLFFVLALSITVSSPPARATEPTCGKHEHVVVETDDEEGSSVKRCVCDEGWEAPDPGKPCRKAKAAPAKKPKPPTETKS